MATTLGEQWLDEKERETADRFVFDRDRRQYLVAHTLVRRLLTLETGVPEAAVEFWRSSRGRPFVRPTGGEPVSGRAGLDFNLSHSHGYNAVALTRGRRVGVDVERLDRIEERTLAGIAESFAPGERRWLTGLPKGRAYARAVLRLWTLKEAYAKARGLGLALPFESFGFVLRERSGVAAFEAPGDRAAARWCFVELEPAPEVLVALAIEVGEGDGHASATDGPVVRLHTGFPWRPSAPREVVEAGSPTPLLSPGTLSWESGAASGGASGGSSSGDVSGPPRLCLPAGRTSV
ncbi:4'-phosphopantetheinyl transferase superfamily protein [Streptomyces durbertensis]|uniref:4'-phosphopantetheinyl transferase superfamily protein n=2 Tax=Streptomyces durbertensis TaxID=2448886 RepID=A0ABR6EAM8_9ACTN|nr:4'-phosphopantetheinyl transferase superfamily protein [Streptomyces durbertensis]